MTDSPPSPASETFEGPDLGRWMDRHTEILLRAFRVKRWVRDALLEEGPCADVRFDHLDEALAMVIPLYREGRSRVVGVDPDVYLHHEVQEITETLTTARWTDRSAELALRVVRQGKGLACVPWDPTLDEAWHQDPRGGWFVVYPSSSTDGDGEGLVLEGETWSAPGPEGEPGDFTAAELLAWVPDPDLEEAGGGQRRRSAPGE
jgi:hypothetical protein